MLTFKKFLEANVPYEREHLELDKLVVTIKDSCSEALKGQRIWRGSARTGKSGRYNPATGTRVSAGGVKNYYTVLLDTNSENTGWPKRSKSFICSTNERHASTYGQGGTTYVVLPFDEVDVAQANQLDIWSCPIRFRGAFQRSSTIYGMQDFWEELNGAFKSSSWTPSMKEAIDFYQQVDPKAFVRELQRQHLYSTDEVVSPERAKEVLDSFCDQLPKAYSYDEMGCELKKPRTLSSERPTEVWFSGPCVLVTQADWEAVEKEL